MKSAIITYSKLIYLLRQIFCGITAWLYWNFAYNLSKEKSLFSIFSIPLFFLFAIFIFDLIKKHNKEFGKYTLMVGLSLFFLTTLCLVINVGMFKIIF